MVSIALIAAPPPRWKPSQGSFLPAWENALLARAVSVPGGGGCSERKVEKSRLPTALSERASLGLSRLVPAPCRCWACWGGHGASAAAPGQEENPAPGKSCLPWMRPVQLPTACQRLPPEPIPFWEVLTTQQPLPELHEDLPGGAPWGCTPSASPQSPPGQPAQPHGLLRASAPHPEGRGGKRLRIPSAASGKRVRRITSPATVIFY